MKRTLGDRAATSKWRTYSLNDFQNFTHGKDHCQTVGYGCVQILTKIWVSVACSWTIWTAFARSSSPSGML